MFARATFLAWLIVASVVSAYLLAGHVAAMPAPTASRIETPRAAWSMTHVLSTECGCSLRVLEHLVSSRRPSGVQERILVLGLGHEMVERARRAGFSVGGRTAEELYAELGVEAVPALLIASPEGRVVYSGGYTDRKRGAQIADLDLLAAARSQQPLKPLPLYGCAVSEKLRRKIDPLSALSSSSEK